MSERHLMSVKKKAGVKAIVKTTWKTSSKRIAAAKRIIARRIPSIK